MTGPTCLVPTRRAPPNGSPHNGYATSYSISPQPHKTSGIKIPLTPTGEYGNIPRTEAHMTNLANLLKGEITRLARKEIRSQLAALRKSSAKYKQDIAALRRQLTEQQRLISALQRSPGKASTAPSSATRARFSAKGLRTVRARLGLSAADFGRLAGVSGQSIYQWESERTVPRDSQKAAIAGLRSLGKRTALARLAAMDEQGL